MTMMYCLAGLMVSFYISTCTGSVITPKGTGTVADVVADVNIQAINPECALLKDEGDCTDNVRRYYYDATIGFCMEFNYTGCGGNLNNFLTSENCYTRCVCANSKDVGEGPHKITRYYYNKDTEQCEMFQYQGSGGNTNRFLSVAQCKNTCERATLKNRCRKRPSIGTNCNNNSTIKYYYDKHCDCCRKFTYLGCDGNRNRFSTLETCQQTCSTKQPTTPAPVTSTPRPTPPICLYQVEYGDCSKIILRYYYNSISKKCEQFAWSGCGGSENNFNTMEACMNKCTN
ncbi:carboxypeptidase inhibitor SmCI-like [Ruditapes philippinarum]|uniref:carboxypeptidase inhibitor SmCI-like n=1 Tax=Ruditapes philippinarum TaxID=129788 RepID=UPI00295AC3ED|nr:carboxypeptidase inhibitor SmCI-like [Ruditapes philippinarum]